MEPAVGQIALFAADWVPAGWMLCDGRSLVIQQYLALFAILGRQYGGDGIQTFALPNLPGPNRAQSKPPHYIINVDGMYPRWS